MANPEPMATNDSERNAFFPKEELTAALVYLVLGCLWIVESDQLLNRLVGSPSESLPLQTYKGLNFIITTSLVFYLILRRAHHRRRKAEAATREANLRFERVARATSDAIFDWNLEANTVWWSEGMHNLFGYPNDQVRTRMELWSDCVHPEDRVQLKANLERAIQNTGSRVREEFRFQRKDGTYADVDLHGDILRDVQGKAARIIGGMSDVTERRKAERRLAQSHRQLRALSARLESLREEERTRISREIHDELGQMLTGLKMDLRWIEERLSGDDLPTSLNPALDKTLEAIELIDTTIARVQKIATDLRPGTLDTLGLASTIRHEVSRFTERTGIAAQVELPGAELALSRPAATGTFRILQESLTNVARHAGAKEVFVALREEAGWVVLEVRDNGRGLSPDALVDPKSIGLLGMKERAELLGGEIQFAGRPGEGTVVTLRVPCAAEDTSFIKLL
jgi:two-component system sensor histidine kinase UhpB